MAEEFKDNKEENKLSEVPEYHRKSEFNKPFLVQEAVQSCMNKRAVEMKPGYYNYSLEGDITRKIWMPDTRKVFCSSVTALLILLSPEIARMELIKEEIKKIEEEVKEVLEKYSINVVKVDFENNKIITLKERRLPLVGESIPYFIKNDINKVEVSFELKYERGLYNKNLDLYWDSLVYLNDKLFIQLNTLIDKLNYFKQKASF